MLRSIVKKAALIGGLVVGSACHVPVAPSSPNEIVVSQPSSKEALESTSISPIKEVLDLCRQQQKAVADCLWQDEEATMKIVNSLLGTIEILAKGEYPQEWQLLPDEDPIKKYENEHPSQVIEVNESGFVTAIRDRNGAFNFQFQESLPPQFIDLMGVKINKLTYILNYYIKEGRFLTIPHKFVISLGHVIEFIAQDKNGNDKECIYIDNRLLVFKAKSNWREEKVELLDAGRAFQSKVLAIFSPEKYSLEVDKNGLPLLTELYENGREEKITFTSPIYNQAQSSWTIEGRKIFEYILPNGVVVNGEVYEEKYKTKSLTNIRFSTWRQELLQNVIIEAGRGGVLGINKFKGGKQKNPYVYMDSSQEIPFFEQNQTEYDEKYYFIDRGRVVCKNKKGQTLRVGAYSEEKAKRSADFTPYQYLGFLGECLNPTSITAWEGFRSLWGMESRSGSKKLINPTEAIIDNFKDHEESAAYVAKEILKLQGIKAHVIDLSPYFKYVSTRLWDQNTAVWIMKKTNGKFDIYYFNHKAFGKNGLLYTHGTDVTPIHSHPGFSTYKEAIISGITLNTDKSEDDAEDIYQKMSLYWALSGGIKIPAAILLQDGTTKTEWVDIEEVIN